MFNLFLYSSLVENEVKEKSEHTKSLSIDNLKDMKRKLTSVLESSDNSTLEKLGNDDYWAHVNYKCEGKDDFLSSSGIRVIEKKLTTAFQELLGSAGKILYDYKYIKVGKDYYNNISDDWVFVSDTSDKIKYSRGVSYFNSNLEKLIKRYCDMIGEVHKQLKNLQSLQKQLSEQEAVSLWEQI